MTLSSQPGLSVCLLHLLGLMKGTLHAHCGGEEPYRAARNALQCSGVNLVVQQRAFNAHTEFAVANHMISTQEIRGKGFCAGLGYQITAVAATPDQTAAVLSIPRQRTAQKSQEIKHSLRFPSDSVNKQYIAGIAYGRTVS